MPFLIFPIQNISLCLVYLNNIFFISLSVIVVSFKYEQTWYATKEHIHRHYETILIKRKYSLPIYVTGYKRRLHTKQVAKIEHVKKMYSDYIN